ncbi:MAG TPA: TetR/AcrR family transcriptional regulator [Opitutales bacterium]|nr:TetR/AcrR family transcriptional regulator [Opitutales bacterium]
MNAKKKEATKREAILEAASRLFYEKGYNQTGIQQILKESGAARGTFYSFYKSKEELGVAWLKARHTTWNGWLHEAITSSRSPRGKILAAFDFLGEWMASCDYRGCAFLNTLSETPEPESPLRNQIVAHKEELYELFQSLVDEHHHTASPARRKQIGTSIFLLFEGSIIHLQNFRQSWPLEGARKQVEELLHI